MLSYQHAYHAGNAADVHKHALLAVALDYMVQKAKPLSYVETHAGRALYDLDGPEARKTCEAASGIGRAEAWFAPDHPYARALASARACAGSGAYPGSPLIASTLLRPTDRILLAERHPAECAALRATLPKAQIFAEDGPAMARRLLPPDPRRGFLLIDPSYEVKDEFTAMPKLIAEIHRKWPVGVLMLWYPVLRSGAEEPMAAALDRLEIEGAVRHEIRFPPARPGHGMMGSGLYVVNPPWGWDAAAAELAARFTSA
ncbi:MAG: 23S rRNA (adenine(2030)-N(6))-methyltransferase RlmJ [Rhodobacteraceae bacterium]|nr:23S rRNA (adenine(2030)-N(6))-methyltransferase RlmJ [Paracoccaceae bacterium]